MLKTYRLNNVSKNLTVKSYGLKFYQLHIFSIVIYGKVSVENLTVEIRQNFTS